MKQAGIEVRCGYFPGVPSYSCLLGFSSSPRTEPVVLALPIHSKLKFSNSFARKVLQMQNILCLLFSLKQKTCDKHFYDTLTQG